MKTLIFGGTGFIGMHLAKELRQRGHEIVLTGASGRRTAEELEAFFGGPVRQEKLDLTVAYDVYDLVARERPDKIIDISGYAPKIMPPAREVHYRTASILNVLEAARVFEVGQITLTSSSDIYFGLSRDSFPFREDTPITVTEMRDAPYIQAAAKKQLEVIASLFQRQTDLNIRIVRLGGAYGPFYNKLISVMSRMVHAAVRGKPMDLEFDKGQWPFGNHGGDFNYVKDHAFGVATVHDAVDPEHRVYNISSGRHSCYRDFADAVNELYPGAIPPLVDAPGERSFTDRHLDITRARGLGYEPRWSIRDAVQDYAKWVETHQF